MNSLCQAGELATPVFYYLVKTFGCQTVMEALYGTSEAPPTTCPPCKTSAPCNSTAKLNDTDDFDLFGEETEADQVAQQALKKAAAAKQEAPKKKKVIIDKSTLVIDIKPNSLNTDLDALEKAVRDITLDGVQWAITSKKVPIAFGLNKLQMGCLIIDDLVATDDIIERIECIGLTPEQIVKYNKVRAGEEEEGNEDEAFDEEEEAPGMVQSAEIVSFQKL